MIPGQRQYPIGVPIRFDDVPPHQYITTGKFAYATLRRLLAGDFDLARMLEAAAGDPYAAQRIARDLRERENLRENLRLLALWMFAIGAIGRAAGAEHYGEAVGWMSAAAATARQAEGVDEGLSWSEVMGTVALEFQDWN